MDFDDLDEQGEVEEEEDTLPPVEGKIRVLAIHGAGANSNIMKIQTDKLRSIMKEGERCEWDYMDGDEEWDWEGGGNSYTDPSTEADLRHNPQPQIMIGMAQGMSFKGWCRIECKDHTARPWIEKINDSSVDYTANEQVEASCERILEYIKTKGPFDIVLAFSSGTVVINVLTGLLRERGETPPWRLSVFFSPPLVRDRRFQKLFAEPLSQPVIMIYGRRGEGGRMCNFATDDWTNHVAKQSLSKWMYKKPVVLEDGEHAHEIPRMGHNQERNLMRIAAHIFRCCGQVPPFPTKVTKVLPGGETVVEEL